MSKMAKSFVTQPPYKEDKVLNAQTRAVGDEEFCRKNYRRWRIRILLSVIVGYAMFYMVRQNFTMAMPFMLEEQGYKLTDLGWVVAAFSFIYGIGKLVNGYLSDRSNARYFMPIGLAVSALLSIAMGFGPGLFLIGAFYAANGWFQSMGWPPVARMITHWFSSRELGTKWALGATSHQIGGAIIAVFAGYLITNFGWEYAFFVPGVIALFGAVFLLNRLRDRPQEVGLPPVETYKGEEPFDGEDARITFQELMGRILRNRLLWYVSFANCFLYVVRAGIFNWAPMFLRHSKGSDAMAAGWQIGAYEIAGLAGGLAAGWLSDKVFKGRRGPVGTYFMLGLSLPMLYLWLAPVESQVLDTVALAVAGFLVYGPQVLVGVASADFASKRAVGVANGFAGTFAYVGVGISSIGITQIAETWGWDAGFLFFMGCSLVGAFFFALTWNHSARS
ncbi:MAG: MFS transporter [bacterium]|nr:MFS transporter [bacterium]